MSALAGRPFTFDLSFDTPHAAAAAVRADDERAPRHSDEDVVRIRAEATAEGRAAGYAAAVQEREQRMAESLQRLGQGLSDLAKRQKASNAAAEQASLRLAAMLVGKIAPHLIAQGTSARIEALLREMLPKIHDEPRIVVRLADDLIDLMKPRIETVARGSAFEGRIIFLGQPDMKAGDCLIEWADGGVEIRSDAFLAEIDATISRFLSTLALPTQAESAAKPAADKTP